jgi:hypothetical protein
VDDQSDLNGVVHIGALVSSLGNVIQVEPAALGNNVDLPFGFPCAITDARIDGGMSGGPVFSEAGRLLGVWSSSPNATEASDSDSPTFALIWPLLAATMHPEAGLPSTVEQSVFAAAKAGKVDVLDLDWCVPVTDDASRVIEVMLRLAVARARRGNQQ